MKKFGVLRSTDKECPECGQPLHYVNGKLCCLECDIRLNNKKQKPRRTSLRDER